MDWNRCKSPSVLKIYKIAGVYAVERHLYVIICDSKCNLAKTA